MSVVRSGSPLPPAAAMAICRLHDINPYDDFVDLLQRVGQYPVSLVHQLTPRIWNEMDWLSLAQPR